jgi:pyruvate ferredoxin oxidoreductase gamma subunit
MLELRIHGRGGQGVVTAAELLSVAAFAEGRHAQAFPSFGSERTGAPVVSFCRIDQHPIRSHEPITEPGAVVVIDATLLHQVDVFGGLRGDGYVLINTSHELGELRLEPLLDLLAPHRAQTVPATAIARRHLGRPLPNVAMLGAVAALTGAVSLAAVAGAIRERFPGALGERNVAAATDAHDGLAARLVAARPLLTSGAKRDA